MKKTTYLYCLATFGLISLPAGAHALTSHSCGDSLYDFVQTCRDADSVLPNATQKKLYNNVVVSCFPTAFQANNGADETQGNASNTQISACSDITKGYVGSFDINNKAATGINITQNISGGAQCVLENIKASATTWMTNHQQFCYATVNGRYVSTQAKNLHNITDFYRDFVMQDSDPEKEQFRKDNLAKAKKNCGDTFEYFIDASSVDDGSVSLFPGKINIVNKYVFGNYTISYNSTSQSPTPKLVLVAENDISVTRGLTSSYYDSAAYMLTSGKATLTGITSFTGGINARELDISSLYCIHSKKRESCTTSDNFPVKGYTTLSSCENVVLEDEITYTYYRVYLEQLSNCSPTISLVVQSCSQGGFCETPAGAVDIKINGKNYTVNAQNNYRITFDHVNPVKYTVAPTGENTYLFCGTNNAATLSESCAFITNECVEGATEDLENYVNDMNTKAIYSDTLSSDIKSVDSIKITFKGNTEVKIKDSSNKTYTLFSGKDHASAYSQEYVTLPVEYNRTTGNIVPKFKFLTTVDRTTLYPVKTELNVTKSVYIGNKEQTVSDVIIKDFNQGDEPEQYMVAIPLALCYDLSTAAPTDTTRISKEKYRLLYANAPYYIRGYGVSCPDTGCSLTTNQNNLKNLCDTAPIVRIPKAGDRAKSVLAPTESAKSISPEKLKNWSTSLSGYTTSDEKTADFTVFNGDSAAETEYFKIGYTGDFTNNKKIMITDSGWYSFSAEPAVKQQSTSTITTSFYSPVFTVIPKSLGIGNDDYVINDFYKFREVNGFDYRAAEGGLTGILKSNSYVNAGTVTCPMYYNQKLTFSGYLNGYGHNSVLQNNFTNSFYRVPSESGQGYTGAVLIMPLASSGTSYREESSFIPCTSDNASSCAGYGEFVTGKGIPFYTTVTVPGISTDTVRRKTASEKFAYYAKLKACMANNNDYTFAESTDCAETSFTCAINDTFCVTANSVTTDETDISGAVLNTEHQQYASRLRNLNDYTVHMGRLITDNVIGTSTVAGNSTENDTLYSPLIIKEYTDDGWKDLSDSCTVMYIAEESPYKSSLDFSNMTGTISFNVCGKVHDKTATDCNDKHKTFADGSLWLQAVKSGTGNAYVTYSLKNATGGITESPYFHLEHLYDANTSKGSFKFNTFVGNKRIIERKINTGTR